MYCLALKNDIIHLILMTGNENVNHIIPSNHQRSRDEYDVDDE